MYLSELRRLAKDCKFGEYLQTAQRDQLVCGLNIEALKKKVLAEADLTLEKALQISQAFEAAKQETRVLRGCAPQSPPTLKSETSYIVRKDTTGVNTKTTKHGSGDEQACHRCGTKEHSSQNCRFKTQTCHFCKEQGHISRVCRKKMQSRDSKDATRRKRKLRTTHHVEEESLSVVIISQTREVSQWK